MDNPYSMNKKYQFSLANLGAARNLDNYKIITTNNQNGKCIVFFSGNGLYYPNTEAELNKTIVTDRYEWEKIYPHNYEKVIFIRDVYKQWYVEGINNEINSIDKLKVFLDKEIEGFNTTFIGSSAGGYASVLFGNLCGADLIISMSGQFDLTKEIKRAEANEILHKSNDSRYLRIDSLNNENVVYFTPCFSAIDMPQSKLAQQNTNIVIINIKSSSHGVPFAPFALKKILALDKHELYTLSARKHNMLLFSLKYAKWIDLYNWSYIQFKKFLSRMKVNL
jgi:hypothetical protein